MTEETIKALAAEYVKTFWYEQAENIQRKIEMAFKAGYKAALSGTEVKEVWEACDEKTGFLLYGYGEEAGESLIRVKKTTVRVVKENSNK